MNSFEMPAGLAMALTADPEAMRKFNTLSDREKWQVVSGTHAVESDKDMKKYVRNMVKYY